MPSPAELVPDLLGDPITKDYRPTAVGMPAWYAGGMGGRLFDLAAVEFMLYDPTVALGVGMIEAPICTSLGQWSVPASDPQVRQYVMKTLDRFWRTSLRTALNCVAYGYSGSETLYKEGEDGLLYFDKLKPIHPRDVVALLKDGEFAGVRLKQWGGGQGRFPNKNKPRDLDPASLMKPCKGFWIFQGSSYNYFYGKSRCVAAWSAWRDKTSQDGALDIIRMWYYKNAFNGVRIYHPERDIPDGRGGYMPARDLARQMGEWMKTGATVAMPSTVDPKTLQPIWRIEDPKFNGQADGLLDYLRILDQQILRGLLIPDNVVTEATGGGSYSGRKVSEDAFYIGEEDLLHTVLTTLDDQIIRPAVRLNFGPDVHYTIEPYPLIPVRQQAQAQALQGGQASGQGQGDNQSPLSAIFADNTPAGADIPGQEGVQPPQPQMAMSIEDDDENTLWTVEDQEAMEEWLLAEGEEEPKIIGPDLNKSKRDALKDKLLANRLGRVNKLSKQAMEAQKSHSPTPTKTSGKLLTPPPFKSKEEAVTLDSEAVKKEHSDRIAAMAAQAEKETDLDKTRTAPLDPAKVTKQQAPPSVAETAFPDPKERMEAENLHMKHQRGVASQADQQRMGDLAKQGAANLQKAKASQIQTQAPVTETAPPEPAKTNHPSPLVKPAKQPAAKKPAAPKAPKAPKATKTPPVTAVQQPEPSSPPPAPVQEPVQAPVPPAPAPVQPASVPVQAPPVPPAPVAAPPVPIAPPVQPQASTPPPPEASPPAAPTSQSSSTWPIFKAYQSFKLPPDHGVSLVRMLPQLNSHLGKDGGKQAHDLIRKAVQDGSMEFWIGNKQGNVDDLNRELGKFSNKEGVLRPKQVAQAPVQPAPVQPVPAPAVPPAPTATPTIPHAASSVPESPAEPQDPYKSVSRQDVAKIIAGLIDDVKSLEWAKNDVSGGLTAQTAKANLRSRENELEAAEEAYRRKLAEPATPVTPVAPAAPTAQAPRSQEEIKQRRENEQPLDYAKRLLAESKDPINEADLRLAGIPQHGAKNILDHLVNSGQARKDGGFYVPVKAADAPVNPSASATKKPATKTTRVAGRTAKINKPFAATKPAAKPAETKQPEVPPVEPVAPAPPETPAAPPAQPPEPPPVVQADLPPEEPGKPEPILVNPEDLPVAKTSPREMFDKYRAQGLSEEEAYRKAMGSAEPRQDDRERANGPEWVPGANEANAGAATKPAPAPVVTEPEFQMPGTPEDKSFQAQQAAKRSTPTAEGTTSPVTPPDDKEFVPDYDPEEIRKSFRRYKQYTNQGMSHKEAYEKANSEIKKPAAPAQPERQKVNLPAVPGKPFVPGQDIEDAEFTEAPSRDRDFHFDAVFGNDEDSRMFRLLMTKNKMGLALPPEQQEKEHELLAKWQKNLGKVFPAPADQRQYMKLFNQYEDKTITPQDRQEFERMTDQIRDRMAPAHNHEFVRDLLRLPAPEGVKWDPDNVPDHEFFSDPDNVKNMFGDTISTFANDEFGAKRLRDLMDKRMNGQPLSEPEQKEEAELWDKLDKAINRHFSDPATQKRFCALDKKLNSGTMTEKERGEYTGMLADVKANNIIDNEKNNADLELDPKEEGNIPADQSKFTQARKARQEAENKAKEAGQKHGEKDVMATIASIILGYLALKAIHRGHPIAGTILGLSAAYLHFRKANPGPLPNPSKETRATIVQEIMPPPASGQGPGGVKGGPQGGGSPDWYATYHQLKNTKDMGGKLDATQEARLRELEERMRKESGVKSPEEVGKPTAKAEPPKPAAERPQNTSDPRINFVSKMDKAWGGKGWEHGTWTSGAFKTFGFTPEEIEAAKAAGVITQNGGDWQFVENPHQGASPPPKPSPQAKQQAQAKPPQPKEEPKKEEPKAEAGKPSGDLDEEGSDGPTPDWIKWNVKHATDTAKRNGNAAKVEDLAAKRYTAKQIAQELGLEEAEVSNIRQGLGIPSQQMPRVVGQPSRPNPKFEAWLKGREPVKPPSGDTPTWWNEFRVLRTMKDNGKKLSKDQEARFAELEAKLKAL